jgi:hypothetical protein
MNKDDILKTNQDIVDLRESILNECITASDGVVLFRDSIANSIQNALLKAYEFGHRDARKVIQAVADKHGLSEKGTIN